ncbi:hypothetical protein BJX66DRAFT_334209 [Aspergillus keveii]|uniref:BTB domain-containing protein n=1 Tax=Aspergillus keveii TaxID=714993 RepID=A0ABR4GGI4_9EURO
MPSRRIEVPDIRQHQLAGPTIAIVAGGGGKSYNVHERILRNASPFFETALAGPWTESQTRQINLPADDSTAVGIYVSWLYFSAIPVVCGSSSEYLDLARAYVFADKILDGRFHNAIIDALVEKSTNQGADHKRSCPQASVINYVYKYTAEGAPIRKLLEDICARFGVSTVTLIAEEDADISYNVHERLVRAASPFFDKALTGPWKESQTRTLHLPADDGLTVGLYVHWLYYRSLPVGYDKPTTE